MEPGVAVGLAGEGQESGALGTRRGGREVWRAHEAEEGGRAGAAGCVGSGGGAPAPRPAALRPLRSPSRSAHSRAGPESAREVDAWKNE